MTSNVAPLCSGPPIDPTRAAFITQERVVTYRELDRTATAIASGLLGDRRDLEEARVAFLVPPGPGYSMVQWGIWRAGGVAVPLALAHPSPEHERVFEDTDPECVVADPAGLSQATYEAVAQAATRRGVPMRTIAELAGSGIRRSFPRLSGERRAQILFTSGTTGRPKGAVTTHANLRAQTEALVAAWGWTPDDRILHVLPLHHVHGIVNCLCCPLHVGATTEFLGSFDAERAWQRLSSGEITVFMAVPTVYHRLLAALDDAPESRARSWLEGVRALRLAVSGSAALPVPVFEQWRELTGLTLLERYGMTEIGMALSNPLSGERRPGSVGQPLPSVEVRLTDQEGRVVPDGSPGEIEVRGPQVFGEYWNRLDDTRAAFRGGWFRTGDDAVLEDGYYRILGRQSVDILKSGGYKLSALEIEGLLLEHPEILQCAVVGVPDPEWGQVVAAALVLADEAAREPELLQGWARSRMAAYKVPRRWAVVDELPRNAMGKVQKRKVTELFG